ncbi:iron-containing alcohol dehydrogenase [Enterococcus sp. BWB1-3]|uniref:iron-containing alcohol dehydrogenase n=1 Tax=Enterococcus sp. BWB1-3 TaxID=2787713 RepID=UPI0019217216|nr:iron-containing alcohol dehydrogenase [Enterococcus sp. BWB1-3]MBL1230029.1 iron-containing alcohol dehydrogenase [Enterococcus sp. BWB1-3]
MEFKLHPVICSKNNLRDFFNETANEKDLIITNKFIFMPQMDSQELKGHILFQEQFGTGEPNDEMIRAMFQEMKGKKYERIIAIGGGTVIDISKLFVFGTEYTLKEIFEKGATLPKKKKLVIIPTTCGTGSEVTNISIAEFREKKTKIGLAADQLYADEAILIGSLLETIPFQVFATSSVDAFIHAIESYVSPKASLFTKALGEKAMRIILKGYQDIVSKDKLELPDNLQVFLEASTLAGISFGNAGCASVHALSYPIGANYHVPHGKSNYLVFHAVFEKYREMNADLIELEKLLSEILICSPEAVWENLRKLIDQIIPREPLHSLGITRGEAKKMAESVFKNQQRLLVNNPVPFTESDIYDVYQKCL